MDTNKETHKPKRYELLPGIQAWDILKVVCNRFNGIIAGYIFNIGKYYLRLGMKDDLKLELLKMREYIDKTLEELD